MTFGIKKGMRQKKDKMGVSRNTKKKIAPARQLVSLSVILRG
jgi:hypothetical protein